MTNRLSRLLHFSLVLSFLNLLPHFLGSGLAVEVSGVTEESTFQDVRYLRWPTYEGMKQEPLSIISGTYQTLRFDHPVARAAISNSEICDVVVINPQEILLSAKKTGRVNLVLWDQQNQIATYSIQSTVDVERLGQILRGLDDKAGVKIFPFGDSVVVHATTDTVLKAKELESAIGAFDPKAASLVKVRHPKQIFLEVRFAEVNRKASKNFGLDSQLLIKKFGAQTLFGKNSPFESSGSGDTFQQEDRTDTRFAGTDSEVAAPLLPQPRSNSKTDLFLSYGTGSTWVANYLQWLVEQNVLKIIARPNLLAKDGEEAKFLVGGEFPVPVETANQIQVDYKEFGTRLEFKPEVLDDQVIRLKMLAEVSELDFSTTVSFRSTVFPTILKRTQETVAELRDGETLIISGMITQRVNRVNKKFPILGDIPLIDRAFKRDEFARTDVELLVIVTPHIVSPFDLSQKKIYPSEDGLQKVKDASSVFQPAYPDAQGDAINEVLTQNEPLQVFGAPEKTIQRVTKDENGSQKIEVGHEKVQVNVQIDVKEGSAVQKTSNA